MYDPDFKNRFPEVYVEIFAAQTPGQVGAVVRKLRDQDLAGTCTFPVCEGAISAASVERRAELKINTCATSQPKNAQEARAARMESYCKLHHIGLRRSQRGR